MSKINMIKNIKEIHPTTIIVLKVGAFCEAYGKDAYIISYLFNYNLKEENGIAKVGFTRKAMNRVLSVLEEEKIDYLFLDVRNNYDVDEKNENKNLNRYMEIYERSRLYVKKKRKISEINNLINKLIECEDFEEKIKQIEVIIK